MVITDPALISLLRSATSPDVTARPDAAEFQDEQAEVVASGQTQIAAVEPGQKQNQKRAAQNQSTAAATLASQSQLASSDQAAASDATAGASALPVDPQQAIKLIVQSLGVSSKLLDQLTAALGGSSDPVPPSAPLPTQIDTTILEASTIELLVQALPMLTNSDSTDGQEVSYESKLSQAGEKLARQILSSLKPLAPPAPSQSQPTSLSGLGSSTGAEPNSTVALETTQLAAELSNLLQTTLWLSSLDQGELGPASGPQTGEAFPLPKLPPGDGISRLLTVLQLTSAADPNLLLTATSAKSALAAALTGDLAGLAINDSSRVTVEAAALLADPEAAELASTISRSIETVTRLLERVAPAETESLRLALRDLSASVARLTPPPALNPSSVRQPPPETVRTDVARAILAVRLEIDRLTNTTDNLVAQTPTELVAETISKTAHFTSSQATTSLPPPSQTTATQVTGTRLAELVSTVEKKGLELVLHQIAALSGHEQEIGALQRALEHDSLAATTLQTVRLLEKSLGSTDSRGTSRPELSDLRAGLKAVESILVDSLASGAAVSTEKIDLALERLSTLLPSRATTGATDQLRFSQLTKLETALVSLLDQQLTGLKLLAPTTTPLSSAIGLGNLPTLLFDPQATNAELVNQLNILTKIEVPKLDLLKSFTPLLDTIAQRAGQQAQSVAGSAQSNSQSHPANSQTAGAQFSSTQPSETQSAGSRLSGPQSANINQQLSRIPWQAGDQQSGLPQSPNSLPSTLRAQSGTFATPTVQGDQLNALAKSIGLQLDLLSESLALEDSTASGSVIGRPIFSSTTAGSGRIQHENSASSIPAQALTTAASLSRQSSVDDSTDTAGSILGTRLDTILGRIDQLRRMIDDEGSAGPRASESKLLDALHQTARKLQERAGNREQPLAAADLQMAVGQLEELFRDVSGTTKMPTGHQAVAEAIRQIETMIRGQEALSYLNPVMRALGEPTFILFPAVLHGMMVRVELLLYPNVDPDAHSPKREKGNRGKKNNEESDSSGDGKDTEKRRQEAERHSYHRLKVSLTLPNLGPVAVDFAHTLEQALLAVSVPDASAAAAVDSALPELRRAFNGLGYKTVEMAVKGDAITDLQPSWLQELLRLNAITA